MKIKSFIISAFILTTNMVLGQKQDFSMIYIYRTGGLGVNYEYPVIFNKMIVHKMLLKTRFSYKIYSEGLLNIELAGNVKI